jgi:DmsE family decaheme c-type cytochrome
MDVPGVVYDRPVAPGSPRTAGDFRVGWAEPAGCAGRLPRPGGARFGAISGRSRTPSSLLFLLAITLVAGCAPAQSAALSQESSKQEPAKSEAAKKAAAAENAKADAGQAEPAKEKTFVGNETCQMCHDEIVKAFARNAHKAIAVNPKRGWKAEACESCHGPGSVHAESTSPSDIINPRRLEPAAIDRGCLGCHQGQKTHAGRIQSGHSRNQVSCIQCHSIHGTQGMGRALRNMTEINAMCASCHTPVWAEFQRPYRHRLTEGAMSCVDCHNPHGSFLPRMVRTVSANEPGCLKCHVDKRGPFTFEHAPVRLEGCSSCHMPHGSSNPKMLTRPNEQQLCLECHSNLPAQAIGQTTIGAPPPAFHDLRNARFRACSTCHVKVHGSYVNRAFTR